MVYDKQTAKTFKKILIQRTSLQAGTVNAVDDESATDDENSANEDNGPDNLVDDDSSDDSDDDNSFIEFEDKELGMSA